VAVWLHSHTGYLAYTQETRKWTLCRFRRGRYQYEVKWWVSLADIVLSDKMDDTPVEWKQKVDKAEKEIKVMKGRVKELKATLRREMKEIKDVSTRITGIFRFFIDCCSAA